MTRYRLVLIGILMTFTACASPRATARVIGYMPAWKGLPQTVDRTDLRKLTHINIAFLNPDAEGRFLDQGEPTCMRGATAADVHHLVEAARAAQVKVLVSLGGGLIPECSGDWEELLQPARRTELVEQLQQFVEDFGLDGIDVDLEGRLLTAIDESGNYTPFVRELADSQQPQGRLVTCATASYEGGMIPVASIPFFDFVNIMSYDAIGPSWGRAGAEHSTVEQSVAHIETWRRRGLPREKLVLGVPFYGYGFGDLKGSYSYGDILDAQGETAAQTDLVGRACDGCSYITYNGRDTIRRKTTLALNEGAGVMIWEMSQDASVPDDLLSVIDEQIRSIEQLSD